MCEVQNHWFTKLDNGRKVEVAPADSGGLAHAAAAAAPAIPTAVGATTTMCAPASHQHVVLIYAHFSGQGDDFSGHAQDIANQFITVDQAYYDFDARSWFGYDAHMYVECTPSGGLLVHDLALSTPIGSANFSTIVSDAQSAGYCQANQGGSCDGQAPAHYWIWTDGNPTSGYAGQSSVIGDDSAGSSNAINTSDGYSINFGYMLSNGGAGIFAHENGHAMGAVQLSAPHSTGAWHCTDGLDVMCYNDGGSAGAQYSTSHCGDAANGGAIFDCGFDDYFNPWPQPGNYLATHWNIGAGYDAWLALQPIQVSETKSGSQLVFWRAGNGDLTEAWYSLGSWSAPLDLSTLMHIGPIASAPSATVTPDGSQQLVFWQSPVGDIMEAWYTNGHWYGPADLTAGFGAPPAASAPSAVVTSDGSQQLLFWRVSNGHTFEEWFTNGEWHGPIDLSAAVGGPPAVSAPDVTVGPDGSQQLVFWQAGNNHIYEVWWAEARWNGPIDLTAVTGGPGSDTPPTVLFTSDGAQQLAFWVAGNHVLEAWWATAQWNGPIDVSDEVGGASAGSALSAAVTPSSTQQLVFWSGGRTGLWEAWWAQSRWNGPANLFTTPLGSSPSVILAP